MNKSVPKDLILRCANSFYQELKDDAHGRYRSWEYCYTAFCDAREQPDPDDDYLSLMLAFYLASWGMYRGSSFLLQKDYKIHIPVVKELLKDKYDCLVGANCEELKKEETRKLIFDDLNHFMKKYYDPIRRTISEKDLNNDLSDTLITKILMGTLACVPAYDRYFISGITEYKVSTRNYNEKSLLKLIAFYEENYDDFEAARKKMKVGERSYPQMKMLDMSFWKIGFDLDNKKGLKKSH
ncbi:MAG: hypothetical protein IKF18_04435 [Erysipelotrichaceae bacterium]|nr:hypothetical protein [Erysipelotrichaceae bacterium]